MWCDPAVGDLCYNKRHQNADLLAPSPPSPCVRLWYLQKGRQLLTSRAEFSNKEKVINLVSPRALAWMMSATQGPPRCRARGDQVSDQDKAQLGEKLSFLQQSHVACTCGAVITENSLSCKLPLLYLRLALYVLAIRLTTCWPTWTILTQTVDGVDLCQSPTNVQVFNI